MSEHQDPRKSMFRTKKWCWDNGTP